MSTIDLLANLPEPGTRSWAGIIPGGDSVAVTYERGRYYTAVRPNDRARPRWGYVETHSTWREAAARIDRLSEAGYRTGHGL